MNTRILLTIGLLSILSVFCYGQSGFPYQAVLRDDMGATINNREIDIRFSIYQGDDASPVYQEEHETTTSASGQFSVEIGSGQSLLGDFQSIDWSHPSTSIQVEVNQGSGYTLMGRQELLSVPYAQYADLSGGLQNFTEGGKNYQLTVDDLGNLQVVEIPEGYTKLVFQDEFNGTGLPDESKWGYEVGFVRNHEMQYYTEKRVENVFQKDGVLHIRCINEDTIKNEQGEILNENITDGKKYYITSGSITTEGKHDWTYCRVEARLKVPLGSGTWSAIWMMPSENTYGYWPRSGEIDIMEYIGNTADKYNCATHFYSGDKGSNKSVENVEDWHIIAFEWHEDRMEWYIDGRMYYRTLNPNTNWGDWPFDQPFYLILNFAFGGGWGERDPLIAYNNVFVGGLGKNMDDPSLNGEKEKYGNVVLDAVELTQLGLTPRMQDDNYVTYLPITDASSILIDKGLSSTVGVEGFDKELIPAADIRGLATNGTKDIGSFEYGGTSGIFGVTMDNQSMFALSRNGNEAVVRNLSDSPLNLSVFLLDGRCIYNASLQDELIINKSELEIPNGVLIFSANDGNRTESQKVILF